MKEKPSYIHHVAVVVKDIAASVAWYRENTTCEIEYEDQSWAMLRFENIALALVLPKSHPPHIAFLVDDADSFGHASDHRDHTRSVYGKDPSGNSVEYIEIPEHALVARGKPHA
jgi:catechol 2,3-dioxygenase-like lactoylglutathione lyase family enzyme